jgi:hypothetical protein
MIESSQVGLDDPRVGSSHWSMVWIWNRIYVSSRHDFHDACQDMDSFNRCSHSGDLLDSCSAKARIERRLAQRATRLLDLV